MNYVKTKIIVGFSIKALLVVMQNVILKNTVFAKDTTKSIFEINKLTKEDLKKMSGKSYVPKKSIDPNKLRKLTISYVGFDEEDHIGQIIVNETVATEVIDIFKELYTAKYQIEKIKLIDEYDADDVISMDDNNSSAYNHRYIAGTKKLSNHAMGLAIDINPIQNPYVKNDFVSPLAGKDYLNRNENKKGMVIKDDVCYNAFVSRGWTWGGDWKTIKDYQHFEKNK